MDERLKHAGEVQVASFLNRIDKKISVDHHDMGAFGSAGQLSFNH